MKAGGIDPAVHALRYWERRQEAAAHNLANVSTPGFKAERVFARLLENGAPALAAATDFTPGAVAETGRPLDVALQGDGFLVVETPIGERYVRGGSFSLDVSGTLVTPEGHAVLGDSGPLVLPPGPVEVERDGTVLVNGTAVGRLRVELPGGTPTRAGAAMWVPDGDGTTVPQEEVRVKQGYLEESNVDPVSALVEMIEIQRAYGAIQRSVQVADEVMQTITTDIGRVGS